jgi:hypothetical protein
MRPFETTHFPDPALLYNQVQCEHPHSSYFCHFPAVADASVSRPSSSDPAFQTLPLSGKPGISFVGSCCREVTWPTPRNVFASNLLVTQSNLQAAFVGQAGKLLAWVTSSQGASKPVAGAKVQVYLSRYNEVSRQ